MISFRYREGRCRSRGVLRNRYKCGYRFWMIYINHWNRWVLCFRYWSRWMWRRYWSWWVWNRWLVRGRWRWRMRGRCRAWVRMVMQVWYWLDWLPNSKIDKGLDHVVGVLG